MRFAVRRKGVAETIIVTQMKPNGGVVSCSGDFDGWKVNNLKPIEGLYWCSCSCSGFDVVEYAVYRSPKCAPIIVTWAPFREQARSQQGRRCTEHVVTLRLFIDFANRRKQELFVCYVEFSMANDRVPCFSLFHMLLELGCGLHMLATPAAVYSVVESRSAPR
ncbi:hypothetical protein E2C01_030943 [Portunus trituberculatus]|uniref:Uncharacterized protein n=1 Tax=Portunus trituberculatus TaxID=210409 RepID=A0A5B7EX79_PORTR|nr:hypothetical protein [Portunus trituberculatus]